MVHGIEVACKSGYVYELNRDTGKPATPVKETPPPNLKTVGAQTLKEDRAWAKTQPIPAGDSIVPHCVKPTDLPGPAPDGYADGMRGGPCPISRNPISAASGRRSARGSSSCPAMRCSISRMSRSLTAWLSGDCAPKGTGDEGGG